MWLLLYLLNDLYLNPQALQLLPFQLPPLFGPEAARSSSAGLNGWLGLNLKTQAWHLMRVQISGQQAILSLYTLSPAAQDSTLPRQEENTR